MKKTGILFLVAIMVAMVFSLASCGGGGDSAGEEEAPAEETPVTEETPSETADDATGSSDASGKVGFIHFNVGGNNYCTTYDKRIKEYVAEKYPNMELIALDAKGDATVQLDQINDLISQQVAVAIIWPVSGTGVIPGLEKLKEADIPIINTNSMVEGDGTKLITAFSGPSDFRQGQQAGEAMVAALEGKGKVVELNGAAGYDTSIQRQEGFEDGIKDSEIEVLAAEPTEWSTDKAQNIMQTFLTKYGDEITGVFCADDGISAGVMNALEAVGKNDGSIKITSCTMFGSGYDAIKDGKQYASILQSPLLDAELAADLAAKLLNGETIESDNRIETFIVDQTNYEDFERPVW
jgi:ribose transport system substrate-binding protein